MKLRRLVLPILAVAAVGLSACGGKKGVEKFAESEGVYATIGSVQYQVQISRQLNPADVEDRDYLTGVEDSEKELEPDEVWFGIFIRAKNLTKIPLNAADEFVLEDTVGEEYERVKAENPFDYEPQILGPGDVLPSTNEAASYSPTQGLMLLFKVTNSTLDNRPLEMKIVSPDGDEGAIEIDV